MSNEQAEILPITKQCISCRVQKSLDEFDNDYRLKCGKKARCKECYPRKARYAKEKSKAGSIPCPKNLICAKCGIEKPYTDFFKKCTTLIGRDTQCKVCVQKRCHSSYINNRQKRIEKATICNRKRKYGVTHEIYNSILAAQDKKCAICLAELNGSRFSLKGSLDHCHTTKKIRGILCGSCNTSLGGFRDREDLLLAAVKYLSKYREV